MDVLKSLLVNAEAHRQQNDCCDIIMTYEQSLLTVKELLLSELEVIKTKSVIFDILHGICCHIGTHYWTSSNSRQTAKDVLAIVLQLCGSRSILELLVGVNEPTVVISSPYLPYDTTSEANVQQPIDTDVSSHKLEFPNGLLNDFLTYLRSKLQKGHWKKYPNAKHALLWCLKSLKHPYVGEYVDSFLPPLLMFLDDHEIYHKRLGLIGMNHLITNTDVAQLIWYGRAEVIFVAMKGLLYLHEVEIIHYLHPCLLKLLPVLQGPTIRNIDSPLKPNVTDEVFTILLYCMNTESKIAVRKAYVTYISKYINLMGIYSVRYIKQLLSIISSYIEYPDYHGEQTRIISLQMLLSLMKNTWPRIPNHSDTILKLLFKLISDLCPHSTVIPDSPEVQSQISLIIQCLICLAHCQDNITLAYNDALKETVHSGLKHCLENTLLALK